MVITVPSSLQKESWCNERQNTLSMKPSHYLIHSAFPCCWISAKYAYIHSSHIAVIRLPDLLHHLLLSSRACFDWALHCDSPLWVVEGQVLETGQSSGGTDKTTNTRNAEQTHATLLNGRRKKNAWVSSANSRSYGEIVILVPVSCSIFFRLRPSFPINLPTKLLCASIFSGISSVLHGTHAFMFTLLIKCLRFHNYFRASLLIKLSNWSTGLNDSCNVLILTELVTK